MKRLDEAFVQLFPKDIQEKIKTDKAIKYLTRGKLPVRNTEHLKHRNKFLYFARCGDTVKIGVSDNPHSRMEDLQTGGPYKLEILAQIPKAGHHEHACHTRLAHIHLYGEWFRYTAEVDALIEEMQRG